MAISILLGIPSNLCAQKRRADKRIQPENDTTFEKRLSNYVSRKGASRPAVYSALPANFSAEYKHVADHLVAQHVLLLDGQELDFKLPVNWAGFQSHSRSFQRLIHGHVWLQDLVYAYRETNNTDYLLAGMDLVFDWITSHPMWKEGQPDAEKTSQQPWLDETTALRQLNWILFFDAARQICDAGKVGLLFASIEAQTTLLASSDYYAGQSNHGMFQDFALLVYSHYFEDIRDAARVSALAKNRLSKYFDSIISPGGVHLEHSPKYHSIIAEELKHNSGWLEKLDPPFAAYLRAKYQSMLSFSIHITKPDGKVPQFGDTQLFTPPADLYDNPEYLFSASAGEKGVAPQVNSVVFEQAGYAIFRDDWHKKKRGTYVAFVAARHNRYHKHEDDLSFWVYSGGDIITEAGAYGYEYQDKYSKYGYSEAAHNVLYATKGFVPVARKQTQITHYSIADNVAAVSGTSLALQNVIHSRELVYDNANAVIVVSDTVQISEYARTRKPTAGQQQPDRRYDTPPLQLLYHLAPDIEVIQSPEQLVLKRGRSTIATMTFASETPLTIEIVKGKDGFLRDIQGWYFETFGKKTPTNVVVLRFDRRSTIVTMTLDLATE